MITQVVMLSGRESGGEISRALPEHHGVPTPAPDASAAPAGGEFEEGSVEA